MVQITVIIPTCDRQSDLNRCLDGLLKNDIRFIKEIIIVDDFSKNKISINNLDLPIKIIRNTQPLGAAKSRNKAINLVDSEIIAFLDDDAIPTYNWISTIIENLKSNYGGITGPVYRFDKGLVSKARQARYNKRYEKLTKNEVVDFFSGGNSAIWTALIKKIGGFNNLGSGGDNQIVNDIRGEKKDIYFIPNLIILHRNSKGFKKAVVEAFNSGFKNSKKISFFEFLRKSINVKDIYTDSFPVFLLNWFLNIVHMFGRLIIK